MAKTKNKTDKVNPLYPSTTGKPSGKGRGNISKLKGKK